VSGSHSPDKNPDTTARTASGGNPARSTAKAPDGKRDQASTGRQPSGGRPGQPSGGKSSGGGRKGAQGRTGRPAPASRPGRHRLSAAERARAKRRRTIRAITITVAVVVVIGGIAGFLVLRNLSEQAAFRNLHVQSLPDLGQKHLDPGGKYTKYNSTPPTSGPHDQTPAPCGVTTEAIPNEVQVHDLEHGVIMVQYKPGLDPAQVSQLEALGRSYSSHVIVAPYPRLPTAVAATAWTKLMTLDRADTDKLRRFIDLYRQKGPELGVACPAAQGQ